jgi:phytoene dehydrogenase-like protein
VPSATAPYDAIVIGGGHNGLTAAAYLGKGGLRTLVLERRAIVGGAAVTEEFHPGYRNSIASYVLSLLRPEIIRGLQLKRHGLELIPFRGGLDILGDGRTLLFTGEEMHDRVEVGRFSNRDYEAMGALRQRLQRVGEVVREQLLREPPELGGGLDALLPMLRLGGGLRRLSPEDRHFLVQMFTLGANDLMERWFESEAMRQVYAVHCVSSNFASLDAPGSAIPFFINVLGEFEGKRGRWGLARGRYGRRDPGSGCGRT